MPTIATEANLVSNVWFVVLVLGTLGIILAAAIWGGVSFRSRLVSIEGKSDTAAEHAATAAEAVGTPNGKGPVLEIVARMEDEQASMREDIAGLAMGQVELHQRLDGVEHTIAQAAELGQLAREGRVERRRT